jgi:RNA-binding protein YlmH
VPQVRSVNVKTRRVALSELSVPEPKVEEMKTFEASMRLDSIAGAGFKLSRSKMTDLVKKGDVRWVATLRFGQL